MILHDISSPANPLIKRLKSLSDKKARRAEGLFLAEGLRVCTEALAAGHTPAILAITPEAVSHNLGRRLIAATRAAGGQALGVPHDLVSRITGKDNAQGVVAAYAIPNTDLAQLDVSTAPLWVVADTLRDPGNLGTMLRSCDATGAGGLILLDDCADPFSLEAVRASMGAVFSRKVYRARAEAFFHWRAAQPGQLIGAALDPSAIDYRACKITPPSFILMGNEQAGLPPAYLARCDAVVSLPMKGSADSLNVAVATGVLLYAALAQLEP